MKENMNKKSKIWLMVITLLLIASLACSAFGGGDSDSNGGGQGSTGGGDAAPTETLAGGGANAGGNAGGGNSGYDTEFPMPDSVEGFTDLGDGSINFQTQLSLKDTIAFYQESFTKAGYVERTLLTSVSDSTFSMVFDGHASGKAIVIQGVDLGGTTNVNIRFEDV